MDVNLNDLDRLRNKVKDTAQALSRRIAKAHQTSFKTQKPSAASLFVSTKVSKSEIESPNHLISQGAYSKWLTVGRLRSTSDENFDNCYSSGNIAGIGFSSQLIGILEKICHRQELLERQHVDLRRDEARLVCSIRDMNYVFNEFTEEIEEFTNHSKAFMQQLQESKSCVSSVLDKCKLVEAAVERQSPKF